MGLTEWIGASVAVCGVVIAAIKTWHAMSDARAKRFLDRSMNLLSLRAVVASEGRVQGDESSEQSPAAHDELLRRFDLGARANAVRYLEATSPLARPGSLVAGIGLLIYGVIVITIAFHQFRLSTPTTDAEFIGMIIVLATFSLTGLVLIGFGVEQIVRRLRTLRLRIAIGLIDDLTREGVARIGRGMRVAFGMLLGKFGRPSAEN